MGSPSELSLNYMTNGYSTAQKRFGDQPEQSQKLDEFLARLEEERLKIEAFKRELPLCMQLLNNALEAYRQQLEMNHTNQGPRPVLEEFIPLKVDARNTTEAFQKSPASGNESCEKASWMTSAQLWSPAESGGVEQVTAAHEAPDHGFDVNPKLVLDNKQRNGGAFHPFTRDWGGWDRGVLPELALAPVKELEEKKCADVDVPRRDGGRGSGGGGGAEKEKAAASATNPAADGGAVATQSPRKARRCWSPDLHRRFVNALQMLGGSQVATPKQIKELMKVDGLTNDEVKSHLQKYRLHTRRPIPAPPTSASAAAPQLVVLGRLWFPPEYAAAAAAAPGIYAGHATPAQYCAAPMPQDFYSTPPHAAHHLQAPPKDHRGDGYKVKHESPEPDVRGSGDNSESIKDGEEDVEEVEDRGRSESSSWKGEDEKALVLVREDGEESNGSDVTLKF